MSANIQTRFFTTGSADEPVMLREGGVLPGVTLAYEVWGELNEDCSNGILLFHALSGSHHAVGYNPSIEGTGDLWQPELHHGWWEEMIGPGKAIDTNQFCVICANYLGGCYGSTSPASINPDTGKPWGSAFPAISAADQADLMARLLDELGIDVLNAVVGPSVGGLLALTFATRFPTRVKNVISMASGFKTTVLNRLILFEQILAIENDPHFKVGDYYGGEPPLYGLALARMISQKTFVHLDSIERRARRDVVQSGDVLAWYRVRDQVQSYMLHQGKKFVGRFDANTYLRIIDMWSRYDGASEGDAENAAELFARSRENGQRWLVFSIDSDFCFYPEEQAELVKHLEEAKVDVMHITVHSEKGHDSFLLEPDLYTPHVSWLLSR
ncbi:homoserine O-acetyltransferase [Luteolibacter pohnpeiensis]|uniref:Homoserine O-acetyltransferase n=1 Tax=Luteolibacter pohnpeiensis TaxID=454153 RepID=A0A934VSE5_9BACT|nr:homoserine O-acetyltransferase [Luteolibacter pohnpeiensis]MBK1884211.1 homoserine O-acetyltransferase [Luteolibacter pohnpeiensis]